MTDLKRVFIHIGAPQAGTSYIQDMLYDNLERLEEHGITYPLSDGKAQHTMVWGLRWMVSKRKMGKRYQVAWHEVVRKVWEWQGHTAVLSSELFAFSTERECKRVLSSFGDAEVHVIYTARDLARQAPAVWQEQMKNQRTFGYGEYLDDLLNAEHKRYSKSFWNAQDAVGVLANWSAAIDASRIHVVTLPPAGSPPELLWQRFAGVIGIDSDDFELAVPATDSSVSVTAAEVLRRFNVRHGKTMTYRDFMATVLARLNPILPEVAAGDDKLPLAEDQRERLGELARHLVDGLRAAGYDIVGSLDELIPAPPEAAADQEPARGPDDVSDPEVIDALLDVLYEVLRRQPEPPSPSPRKNAQQGRARKPGQRRGAKKAQGRGRRARAAEVADADEASAPSQGG
ncbi:MAG: hypothetical protein ACR2KG_10975 [Nocardioidaceae bacterium]